MKHNLNKIKEALEFNSDILNNNFTTSCKNEMYYLVKLKRKLNLLKNVYELTLDVSRARNIKENFVLKANSEKLIFDIHNLNIKLGREEIYFEKNPFTYYDEKVDKFKTKAELKKRFNENIKFRPVLTEKEKGK